jgi:hypothetical protein
MKVLISNELSGVYNIPVRVTTGAKGAPGLIFQLGNHQPFKQLIKALTASDHWG